MNLSNIKNFLMTKETAFLAVSFILVAFGQPAWNSMFGLAAAICGFGLFWIALIRWEDAKKRFWISAFWYAGVQFVQLSWMLSHPFLYIYGVYAFLFMISGIQFGILGALIRKESFSRIYTMLAIAALWTLMEWVRLFILSGHTWNPVGLALTGHIFPLQMASLWGIYGLSFWVIITNLFAVKAWLSFPERKWAASWLVCVCLPYLFGIIQLQVHDYSYNGEEQPTLSALLIQPAFPAEAALDMEDPGKAVAFVIEEWRHMLSFLKDQTQKTIDLIAFPEYVVPYGTYFAVFPHPEVEQVFLELFGPESLQFLPPLKEPYAKQYQTELGPYWFVSNAYWAQAVANLFKADVVVGLEDVEHNENNERACYSAAFHFSPKGEKAMRYEKQVLIPMGEYIPFSFCRDIAAEYGIAGSFTKGKEAKVFNGKVPFGVAICYEETFGDLIRQNRLKGAQLLVNLTSDVWYPNSRLPQQHFDHGLLRTVENGIPLLRSCNTGVTGAIDCFGRVIKVLGNTPQEREMTSGALHVNIPLHHYPTFYSIVGDKFIIGLSSIIFIFAILFGWYKFK